MALFVRSCHPTGAYGTNSYLIILENILAVSLFACLFEKVVGLFLSPIELLFGKGKFVKEAKMVLKDKQ